MVGSSGLHTRRSLRTKNSHGWPLLADGEPSTVFNEALAIKLPFWPRTEIRGNSSGRRKFYLDAVV